MLLEFSKKYSFLPARWMGKENIHITLNFLGNLDDNQLLETIETTKKVSVLHRPFLVKLDKACYGPPKKFPPRMVWLTIDKSEPLFSLQNDLENSLFNLPSYQYKIKERRGFSPHITLARIKSFEFRRLGRGPEIEEDMNLSFEVDSIEVMESHPKKTGAEYTILESVPL